MNRVHTDSILYYFSYENSKVFSKHKREDNYLFHEVLDPLFDVNKDYVVTVGPNEEEKFLEWKNGAKLEYDSTSAGGVKVLEDDQIPMFHKYNYRIVSKTPYEEALEEANEQKDNGGPIDIYKWHFGSGEYFKIGDNIWDFYNFDKMENTNPHTLGLSYRKDSIYRKR